MKISDIIHGLLIVIGSLGIGVTIARMDKPFEPLPLPMSSHSTKVTNSDNYWPDENDFTTSVFEPLVFKDNDINYTMPNDTELYSEPGNISSELEFNNDVVFESGWADGFHLKREDGYWHVHDGVKWEKLIPESECVK